MTAMEPLRITAHLATGYACAAPWGIALDGLLASELRAEQKNQLHADGKPIIGAMESDNPPDLPLPLARCTLDTTWHWAATCGAPTDPDVRPDIHTWTSRVDHRHLEHTTTSLPRTIPERQGRYKATRMPLLVTPARSITWHAVGEPDRIADILDGITAIGKKRSQGEGHVLRWEVLVVDVDPFMAGHCWPDGTLGRPTPPGCLRGHPELATRQGRAGIRPPYMHPSRRGDAFLPDTWRDDQ